MNTHGSYKADRQAYTATTTWRPANGTAEQLDELLRREHQLMKEGGTLHPFSGKQPDLN